jgi:hypothetical protein
VDTQWLSKLTKDTHIWFLYKLDAHHNCSITLHFNSLEHQSNHGLSGTLKPYSRALHAFAASALQTKRPSYVATDGPCKISAAQASAEPLEPCRPTLSSVPGSPSHLSTSPPLGPLTSHCYNQADNNMLVLPECFCNSIICTINSSSSSS